MRNIPITIYDGPFPDIKNKSGTYLIAYLLAGLVFLFFTGTLWSQEEEQDAGPKEKTELILRAEGGTIVLKTSEGTVNLSVGSSINASVDEETGKTTITNVEGDVNITTGGGPTSIGGGPTGNFDESPIIEVPADVEEGSEVNVDIVAEDDTQDDSTETIDQEQIDTEHLQDDHAEGPITSDETPKPNDDSIIVTTGQ